MQFSAFLAFFPYISLQNVLGSSRRQKTHLGSSCYDWHVPLITHTGMMLFIRSHLRANNSFKLCRCPEKGAATVLLRCNYCAWSPGEEVSSAPPPHQSAPGPSQMSLGWFDLQRVVVANTICSLLWGHRRASCSWYLCGVSSWWLPLKGWSLFHQLYWASLRYSGCQVPPHISEVGYGISALTHLPCLSDAHYNFRTTTLEILL